MVKKTVIIALSAFFLSVTSAVFLSAGEFTAAVSSTQVALNENFTLSLTLKDASAKEAPVASALKKHFLIRSQQQSTNTTIVNGRVSSSVIWRLTLTPRVDGVIQIPPITVDTTQGPLSTQPITLNVAKSGSLLSSVDSAGLNLITKVSNASPYKNEPFIYTALLTSKTPLYNVQAQKIQAEDAIVELVADPKLEERVIDGVSLNVVEFNYLITPLKPGSLTIPPIAIQGAIPLKRRGQSSSFLNDSFDPFAIVQGFDILKPVTLMTDEIHLDVQPAIPEVSPWLPAKRLILEEQWSSDQTLRVGEPFSRGFLIKAKGLKVSQLPHLEDLQSEGSTFKVYADKPEEQEAMFQGVMNSIRKEQYTLIPQQAGTTVLPEISISWWDSGKKEKQIATIPARTLEILPALATATSIFQQTGDIPTTTAATEVSVAPVSLPYLLYGIIGTLAFCLAAALLWGFTLQRKIASFTGGSSQKPVQPQAAKPKTSAVLQQERKERLPDLNPT